MARSFNSATPNYYNVPLDAHLGTTFFMGSWVAPANTTGTKQIITKDASGSPARNWQFRVNGSGVDFVGFVSGSPVVLSVASGIFSAGVWTFIAARRTGGNLVMSYWTPGGAWTHTNLGAIGAIDFVSYAFTTIAARDNGIGGFAEPMSGRMQNPILAQSSDYSDNVVQGIAIRPWQFADFSFYAPLAGFTTEPDWGNGHLTLTVGGAPAVADGAPIAPYFSGHTGWRGAFTPSGAYKPILARGWASMPGDARTWTGM